MKNKVIVFDLDDTLYKEIDYLKSAYKAIVDKVGVEFGVKLDFDTLFSMYSNGDNVFDDVIKNNSTSGLNIEYLLDIYRFHLPNISIGNSTRVKLLDLKTKGYILGIITDGRSKTQRNKIKALELDEIIDEIVISEEFGSEKPNEKNYLHFQDKFPDSEYFYIGDNVRKDFVTPNKLGWKTIGVKDTDNVNIHSQNIKVENNFLPNTWVNKISDIKI